jgi:hypothetical protein
MAYHAGLGPPYQDMSSACYSILATSCPQFHVLASSISPIQEVVVAVDAVAADLYRDEVAAAGLEVVMTIDDMNLSVKMNSSLVFIVYHMRLISSAKDVKN